MALAGEATVESCVRRFHVYRDVWVPVIGETLPGHRGTDNSEDRYAVAYYKSEEVVGHVAQKILRLCAAFLRRGRAMKGTVIGYSSDLEQGGMEIPCKLTFMGPPTELQKMQKFFVSALGVWAIFSCPITSASLSSSLGSVIDNSSVTTTSSDSPSSKKQTLDTWAKNRECPLAKCVKCNDSLSESSSTATGFFKPPPAEDYIEGDAAHIPVKCITVSDAESSFSMKSTEMWVRFQRSSLTLEDKYKIENGLRLTDKHISFANSLISRQFPHIGGLRSTLLQNRYYSFPLQSIQPIFCKEREHWIVASNVMQTSDHRTVNVYNSSFTELNQESYDLILRIFHTRINDDRRTTVVMKELQKQKGSTDCGLFAIAVMTSLAHKEDPSTTKYNQNKMRQHLLDCFSNKFLMPFPKL